MSEVKSGKAGRKITSFMHISPDRFVAGPNGEMNRIKVDEEIFDHVVGGQAKATLHKMGD